MPDCANHVSLGARSLHAGRQNPPVGLPDLQSLHCPKCLDDYTAAGYNS
jgi:hypothetical protein